jgi:hypothetical protein
MDIQLNQINGDLNITNGDFTIGDTTYQEVADIINYFPGELKQFPSVGVGALSYQRGFVGGLNGIIQKQLINDGLVIDNLSVTLDALGKLAINVAAHRINRY